MFAAAAKARISGDTRPSRPSQNRSLPSSSPKKRKSPHS